MPKHESPLEALRSYLPEGSFEMVSEFLLHHKVHLTITRSRATVLGDYRHATPNRNHRISVNGNLNPHAFLITLLHELAHLLTFQHYGNRVQSHGREWKKQFADLLRFFLQHHLFPEDIRQALEASLHNPAASSCADDRLMRVLRRYDQRPDDIVSVEELQKGAIFQIRGGRTFRREDVLRKRIRCVEVDSGKVYLFSPLYEVRKMT
ncbi:MAG: SprT-like domain-containing protein [Chitinophagaceae bacterium]|jgi:hypothetical protein|nr:SprT-like domain-containing protein [Chitinophagaceae bacterium]